VSALARETKKQRQEALEVVLQSFASALALALTSLPAQEHKMEFVPVPSLWA
jgi:hypothetical protein